MKNGFEDTIRSSSRYTTSDKTIVNIILIYLISRKYIRTFIKFLQQYMYFYHINYVMCIWVWHYIYMHKEFCHRELRTQLTIPPACARSSACEIQFSWARWKVKSHVRLSPAFLSKQGRYFRADREIKYSARSIWSFREVWRTLGSHAAHFEGSYFRR